MNLEEFNQARELASKVDRMRREIDSLDSVLASERREDGGVPAIVTIGGTKFYLSAEAGAIVAGTIRCSFRIAMEEAIRSLTALGIEEEVYSESNKGRF